ncbi:MAG: cohesin domain-containing protein [Candidatus Bathyarchaeota archaeon]|nr:cohesin domain-containing protein [Candidatus Bathyarchaeota archaeon]
MKAKWYVLTIAVFCVLLVFAQTQTANAQASSNTIVSLVPAQSSAVEGEALTVNVTISNVENLYGLDLEVGWNNSVLELVSATPHLGSGAMPDGVLYGNQVSSDITEGDVYVNTSLSTANTYHLFATSVAPASSFNGSGTIATLVFNVTQGGHSELTLQSELADHPLPEETNSELIAHTDIGGSVDATVIPEFPQVATVASLLIAVTVALMASKKKLQQSSN